MFNQEMYIYGDAPDRDVIGAAEETYELEKLEGVVNSGTFLYVKGALYPRKGYPRIEEARAINVLKALLVQISKRPLFFIYGPESIVKMCNIVATKIMRPRLVKKEFLCSVSKGMDAAVSIFLVKVGVETKAAQEFSYNFAHIMEFDDAYRYIVQDIATEASEVALRETPIREIIRLSKIVTSRSSFAVGPKVNKFLHGIVALLLIPKYRRAFMAALSIGLRQFRYDTTDWYWVCDRKDYLFGGKTYEERHKEFDVWPQLYKP